MTEFFIYVQAEIISCLHNYTFFYVIISELIMSTNLVPGMTESLRVGYISDHGTMEDTFKCLALQFPQSFHDCRTMLNIKHWLSILPIIGMQNITLV